MKNSIPDFDNIAFEQIKSVALTFPGTEVGISYEGTPSIKIGKRLMCRLHECGDFIVIRLDFNTRERYLSSYPKLFHISDHYKKYPYICMWVNNYDEEFLVEVLEHSFLCLASKKQLLLYQKK